MNREDSGHRQAAVDVGEQLRAALEVLVDHLARQPGSIDLEQHEPGTATEPTVRDVAELMPVRTMDEALDVELSGRVGARFCRRTRFDFGGDVIDRVHVY